MVRVVVSPPDGAWNDGHGDAPRGIPGAHLVSASWLCAISGDAQASGGDYLRRGRRGLTGAGGGASRATTVASHARACGDASQPSAASAR